ncbi:unnamed protein product, partial [Didymodactylos carnosus]
TTESSSSPDSDQLEKGKQQRVSVNVLDIMDVKDYDTLDPLALPSTISTALTNLRYLTLSDLFFDDFLCLFPILQHVITIKIVGLYCNNTDLEQLPEKLSKCTNLYIYMGASDDGATFEHVHHILSCIPQLKKFKYECWSSNEYFVNGKRWQQILIPLQNLLHFELDVHFAPYINFFTQQISNVAHQFKTLFWMERQTKLRTETNDEGFNLNVKF